MNTIVHRFLCKMLCALYMLCVPVLFNAYADDFECPTSSNNLSGPFAELGGGFYDFDGDGQIASYECFAMRIYSAASDGVFTTARDNMLNVNSELQAVPDFKKTAQAIYRAAERAATWDSSLYLNGSEDIDGSMSIAFCVYDEETGNYDYGCSPALVSDGGDNTYIMSVLVGMYGAPDRQTALLAAAKGYMDIFDPGTPYEDYMHYMTKVYDPSEDASYGYLEWAPYDEIYTGDRCGTGEIDDGNGNCECDESNGYYGDVGACEYCDITNWYTLSNNVCTPPYTITYILNGGTNYANAPTAYNSQTPTITLGTPTRYGYEFAGWYDNSGFTGNPITQIPTGSTGNKTLYAKWISCAAQGYTYRNGSCVLNSNCGEGTYFDGAMDCWACEDANQQTCLQKGVAYGCGWDPSAQSCMYCDSSNEYILEPSGKCHQPCMEPEEYWDDITGYCECNEGSGYYRIWGSCSLCDTNNGYFYDGSTCSPITYTITYNLNGGTNYANAPTTYNVAVRKINLDKPTKSGYVFVGWYENPEFTGNPITEIVDTTGNKVLYAQWVEPFSITTTSMNARDSFKWSMSAAGTFTVDCGNGGTLSSSGDGVSGNTITRTHTENTQYACTYTTAGVHNIQFTGSATRYNNSAAAIGFSGYNKSGNTPSYIASISGSLGAVFPTLNDGSNPLFTSAFSNAQNLTSVPSGLFVGVYGAAPEMFSGTFYYCQNLTTVPYNLFAGTSGTPRYKMFQSTFGYDSKLNTFVLADGSTVNYIPPEFFGSIASTPDASNFMTDVFYNTGVATSCPPEAPTTVHDTWSTNYWNYPNATTMPGQKVSCSAASTTITLYKNDGTDGNNGTVTATPGQPISAASKPTRSGYIFLGYYDAASGGNKYYNADMTSAADWPGGRSPAALYAHWTVDPNASFSITFNNVTAEDWPDGASVPTTYTTSSEAITLPTPERDNHIFGGWYDNSGLTGNPITQIATGSDGDKTFWAKWECQTGYEWDQTANNNAGACEPKLFQVSLYFDDSTLATISPIYGSEMPITDVNGDRLQPPFRNGWTFKGYWSAPSGGVKYYNADMTSAHIWDIVEDNVE